MTVIAPHPTAHTHLPRQVALLRPAGRLPLATALRLAAADALALAPGPSTSTPTVATTGGCVADEHHEAWLLTWLPGQGTDWHDHGGSAGAFVVVQGALVEGTAVHGVVRGTRRIHRRGGARRVRPRPRAPGRPTRGPTRRSRSTSTRRA